MTTRIDLQASFSFGRPSYRPIGNWAGCRLCGDGLSEFFDFPPQTKKLTIVISKRKTRDDSYRVQLTQRGVHITTNDPHAGEDLHRATEDNSIYLLSEFRNYLRLEHNITPGTYYVGLDYETEDTSEQAE